MLQSASDILGQEWGAWAPPPALLPSQWADRYMWLSPESSHESKRWKCLPYQPGILDALADPEVSRITVMKSARVGYTKCLDVAVGYFMHHNPKSMLIVQPTVEDAQGYSKDELATMIRDVPELTSLVSEVRARDSENTILKKVYPGGIVHLVGANSPRGFRRISVPIVLFDEVDGYPPTAGSEGDQIRLGAKRAEWFYDRKIVMGSTPTTKELSRIEEAFNSSDKRFYFVPCPFCGEMQTITFPQIRWPLGEPWAAYLECVKCGEKIEHKHKRRMVEQGEWRATAVSPGHAGFFIWAGYSYAPNASWGDIAVEFLACKDDPEKLKTFKNIWLGETYEDYGDKPDWAGLFARCEQYEPLAVPEQGLLLVAGVDVQDNRLAVAVYAFGVGEECWAVYHTEIYGDPGKDDVWVTLDHLIERPFKHASGTELTICSVGVDSGGHHTQQVYNYCRKRQPKVFALKGATAAGKPVIGRPSEQDVDWMGQKIKNGVQLWPIGTDTAKALIYSRLALKVPGPKYFHFYIGLDQEFFQQLTAEKKVTRYVKGHPKTEWVKIGPRNEVLDCTVYAYAAALRVGLATIDWTSFRSLVVDHKPQATVYEKPTPPGGRAPVNHGGRRVRSRGVE